MDKNVAYVCTLQEATRFLMFLFKKVPLKRPTAEECHEHRWLAHSDFMNKKRERAVFLGNRLKVGSFTPQQLSNTTTTFWSSCPKVRKTNCVMIDRTVQTYLNIV
jgi:hypothetical protein